METRRRYIESKAEHMKVVAVESPKADSHLDKLGMVYEEYVKMGKETYHSKCQAVDDVSIKPVTSCF